jgi:hypothetical protein
VFSTGRRYPGPATTLAVKDRLLIDPAKRDGELSYRVETPGDMPSAHERAFTSWTKVAKRFRGSWPTGAAFS